MSLHALDDLDDALDATRALLWPIDRSLWIKLAVVAFFVGTPGANVNTGGFNVPTGGGGPGPGGTPPGGFPAPGEVRTILLIVAAVVVAALLLGLLFLLVGSIMEFVLVESLRTEAVDIRRYWGERWRQGVRLFAFRVLVSLVVLASVAVLAALFLVPVFVGGGPPTGLAVVSGFLLLPVVIVLALLVGLVDGFTTVFVVPVMVLEDCGVLDGWRRLWPTITANPWQYAAYVLLSVVLSIAGGILVAVIVGIGAVLLLIPFGVLAAIGLGVFAVFEPLGIGVLALVGVLFVLAVIALSALAQVPVVTYLRYYALLVLGDVEESLDLIPERRAAIRAASETDDTGGASGAA